MKHTAYFLIILSLPIFFSSCSDESDPDLTAPVIEIESPEDHESFEAGDNIPVNGVYTDDQALASTDIEIHDAFDDHTHGRISEDPTLSRFAYKKSFELPAETAHILDLPQEISIPENVMAGPYHFIVQALDAAGNATSFQDGSNIEMTIFLTNNSMARIVIDNLENGELEIETDSPFIVQGTISDPDHESLHGIEEILIILGEDHEDEHDHDHGRVMEDHLFEAEIHGDELSEYENPDGSLDIEAMIDYTLDESTATELINEGIDHLVLEITVIDMQGNYSIEIIPVHLHSD